MSASEKVVLESRDFDLIVPESETDSTHFGDQIVIIIIASPICISGKSILKRWRIR